MCHLVNDTVRMEVEEEENVEMKEVVEENEQAEKEVEEEERMWSWWCEKGSGGNWVIRTGKGKWEGGMGGGGKTGMGWEEVRGWEGE